MKEAFKFSYREIPVRTAIIEYDEPEHCLIFSSHLSDSPDYDWTVLDTAFCQWTTPYGVPLPLEHQHLIRERLRDWSVTRGLRIRVEETGLPLVVTSRYAGMTTNERLIVGGFSEEFDRAIRKKDRRKAMDLLVKVDLPLQAETIVDTILAHPERYGY